jgi:selenocysteine lyase/cysteine desulfurase
MVMWVGPVHYNTLEEIKRFGEVLGRITGSLSIR